MGNKKTKTRASARITVHFAVEKSEAGGYRHFVERRGRILRGTQKTQILDTKWYPTKKEAAKGLLKARRKFLGRLS